MRSRTMTRKPSPIFSPRPEECPLCGTKFQIGTLFSWWPNTDNPTDFASYLVRTAAVEFFNAVIPYPFFGRRAVYSAFANAPDSTG